jgi:membrane glycosyltransferase
VPGEFDELQVIPHERPASCSSRSLRDRRHGLPVGAALVFISDTFDCVARDPYLEHARIFCRTVPAVSLWPEWRPDRAIALFSTTATLLFAPKLASGLLLWISRRQGIWRHSQSNG